MEDSRSSVSRLTAVLAALAEASDNGVSVRALEARTGVSRSSIQRMLARLADEGVSRLLPTGGYAAGPIFYEWASKVVSGSTLLDLAGAVMRELSAEFDESVYLTRYLPRDQEITFVHVEECKNPLRYVLPMGSRAPLHKGAAGKVVLAWLPRGLIPTLPHVLADNMSPEGIGQLSHDLDAICEDGYGITMGERIREVVGVSAALLVDEFPVGSVSVTIPQSRVDLHSLQAVGRSVHRAAERLAAVLADPKFGWKPEIAVQTP